MRHVRNSLAWVLLLLAQGAFAQITYDGCRDIRGVPVASIMSPGLNDIALASLGPGGAPIIQYNPQVVAWVAPQTRLFFYAHECAHHARGHILGTMHPMATEQDADCMAIRFLVDDGSVDEDDIRQIQGDLARLGRGDWTHLPGPQRAINLRACLGQSESSRSRASSSGSPRQAVASACQTQFGACRLMNAVPLGSQCFCNTPSGPIWGISR